MSAIVPGSVGTHSYSVTYTPNDSQNYNYDRVTLTQDVSVTVNAKSVDDDSIAIAPIADRVIRMHDARVASVETNAAPTPISDIEW